MPNYAKKCQRARQPDPYPLHPHVYPMSAAMPPPVRMCSLGSSKWPALAPHTTIVLAVASAPDPNYRVNSEIAPTHTQAPRRHGLYLDPADIARISMVALATSVSRALALRGDLLASLHAEQTDCYRLFHGAVEGMPGVTLDRYNELLLLNTFRDPPPSLLGELEDVRAAVSEALPDVHLSPVYWCDRRRGAPGGGPDPSLPASHYASELGLRYLIEAPAQGRDPWLYLDFRAARRWLRANSADRDVLNAFVRRPPHCQRATARMRVPRLTAAPGGARRARRL